MKKFFKRIADWNNRAGVKVPASFQQNPEDLDLMIDIMTEEVEELRDAKTKEDVLDSFADQLYVLLGNIARYGLTYEEVEKYLAKVVKSNESKFCDTEAQAVQSIDKEARRLNISPDDLDYKEIDGKFVIFNAISGKILKSVLYLSPEEVS